MWNKLFSIFRPRKSPTLRDAADQLDALCDTLDNIAFMLSQMPVQEPYRKQMADFYTKASFATGSLTSTVKLAAEAQKLRIVNNDKAK